MLAIINAELIMKDHLIPEAVLFIEGDKIAGYGEMRNTPIPEGCQIIDAKGLYVGPGLIDIHTHFGGPHNFWENPIGAARFHLENGTTTVLATPGYRHSVEEYVQIGQLIQEAMASPGGENIGGAYMEGPYINPNFGANRHLNPWHGKGVEPEDFEAIVEANGEAARVWTIDPEKPDILPFVLAAKKKNPNVRFAVGHCAATPQQIEALMPYGLCIGTHHTNATGTIENYPECRGVCVDEGVNYNNDIYAEIICDSKGIHVDPYMQRLVRKIKGDDRIILISDRDYVPHIPAPPGYEGVDDIYFDEMGEISGAKLTSAIACRNWMKHTGASLVEAFKVASYNPARAVGFYDRGEIREGLKADLVITDHKMNISTVILNGKVVK